MPGPKNPLDPAEYENLGGDVAHFRSERPAGATGVADLGMMQSDLLSGIGDLERSSHVTGR